MKIVGYDLPGQVLLTRFVDKEDAVRAIVNFTRYFYLANFAVDIGNLLHLIIDHNVRM